MTYVFFIPDVGFEFGATSFQDEGFDLVMTIGVDEGGEVFGVGLGGVEEGGECGGGTVIIGGAVVGGDVDCSCLC